MLNDLNIVIVGATGKVGLTALRLLEERGHPAERIVAVASRRSAGRALPYKGGALTVETMSDAVYERADIALISATNAISAALAPEFARRGALAIDDSSVFRLDADVPLIVPEVNGAEVERHSGIIAIPNCSVSPLVMALAPLSKLATPVAVTMATYQAVSGAGALATRELFDQTRALLAAAGGADGADLTIEHHPKQIAFNLIPQIGGFGEHGYTSEELKTDRETRKIMGLPDLRVGATCVRVPVETSHSADVTIEFDAAIDADAARAALARFDGITLLDDLDAPSYPMPINSAGVADVIVGRVRADIAHKNGLKLWFSCDNLLKGAALNSLQIADEVVKRRCLPKKNRRGVAP